jgi:hypothetical protein
LVLCSWCAEKTALGSLYAGIFDSQTRYAVGGKIVPSQVGDRKQKMDMLNALALLHLTDWTYGAHANDAHDVLFWEMGPEL